MLCSQERKKDDGWKIKLRVFQVRDKLGIQVRTSSVLWTHWGPLHKFQKRTLETEVRSQA